MGILGNSNSIFDGKTETGFLEPCSIENLEESKSNQPEIVCFHCYVYCSIPCQSFFSVQSMSIFEDVIEWDTDM
jgi:hypothetical protein